MTTYERPFIKDDGTETIVEIEIDSWGSAPQTCGPPEACDPGDPMEVHVERAWLDTDDENAPLVDLSEAERERAETAFLSDPPEQDYGSDEDWG